MLFQVRLFDVTAERVLKLTLANDQEPSIGNVANDESGGFDQVSLTLVWIECGDIPDKRCTMREPERLVHVDERRSLHTLQVDAVVHHIEAFGWDAIVNQYRADERGSADEAVDLTILPARKRVFPNVDDHTAGRDEPGGKGRAPERDGQRGHRDSAGVVGMDDIGSAFTQQSRELPGRGEVHLQPRRQRNEVVPVGCPAPHLAVWVDDKRRPVSACTETKDGQQDLVLSTVPGARGVHVQRHHESVLAALQLSLLLPQLGEVIEDEIRVHQRGDAAR